MAKESYTEAQKKQIIAEFNASGKGITVFCKEREFKPSYQTLKGWIDTAGGVTAKTTTGASKTGLNLEAEFNQAYEQERKTKFLTFLESKRKDLAAQLASVDQEIRNLKTEMGTVDPIVEE